MQYFKLQSEFLKFEEWLNHLRSHENKDESSQVWASALYYLHSSMAYYFAIRSGNWHLRNACLPKLTELFFAYSRNKYEAYQNIKDLKGFPYEILDHFINGE